MGDARANGPQRIVLLAVATALGCGPAAPPRSARGEAETMTRQLAVDLGVVRQGRILFSHHSVGRNVLEGIERLDAESDGGRLRVVSFEEAAETDAPALAHGSGGRNTDPKSKIDFFAATVRSEARLKPDLAFMKLCYVDFDPRTDVQDLFSYYERTLEALKREHPEIRFAHVTVPLFRRPADLKSSLRRLIGLEVWEDAANVKRSEFNRRLRERFASDPLFDLARVEASGPEGAASALGQADRGVPGLHPAYTDDGGHLNALGQRAAGAEAIRFLADALQGRRRDAAVTR